MGKYGTLGVGGIVAAEVTSSDTGAFEATFPIPADLAAEKVIAIRLDAKTGGWYAYNWFYNSAAPVEPTPAPTPAPVVKYPSFSMLCRKRHIRHNQRHRLPRQHRLHGIDGQDVDARNQRCSGR